MTMLNVVWYCGWQSLEQSLRYSIVVSFTVRCSECNQGENLILIPLSWKVYVNYTTLFDYSLYHWHFLLHCWLPEARQNFLSTPRWHETKLKMSYPSESCEVPQSPRSLHLIKKQEPQLCMRPDKHVRRYIAGSAVHFLRAREAFALASCPVIAINETTRRRSGIRIDVTCMETRRYFQCRWMRLFNP